VREGWLVLVAYSTHSPTTIRAISHARRLPTPPAFVP
jgi:hypothetical protein